VFPLSSHKAFYSIKSVCRLTGLRAATLHAWQKRYQAVEPERTATNHRVYSEDDVEKLRLLVAATGLGHSIGNIARLSVTELTDLLDGSSVETRETATPSAPEKKKIKPTVAVLCRRILQAVHSYDLDRLHEELWLAQNHFEPLVFVLDFLVPLFAQIAKAVQNGRLSIAQEHALSAVIKSNLLTESLRLRLNQNRKDASLGTKRVMLTTFDGDYHDFGISLAAIICAESDHIVHWMGPSLPPTAVVEAVNRTRSDILIMPSPKPRYEVLAQHPRVYLEELCPQLPKLCELWIGGDDASFLTPANLVRKVLYFRTLHDLQKHLVRMTS
jgi:DNA-binding transcriptional MerR regulator